MQTAIFLEASRLPGKTVLHMTTSPPYSIQQCYSCAMPDLQMYVFVTVCLGGGVWGPGEWQP